MSKEVAEYTAQGLLGFRYIIACSPPTKRGVTPVTTFDGSFNELAYYEVPIVFTPLASPTFFSVLNSTNDCRFTNCSELRRSKMASIYLPCSTEAKLLLNSILV